MMSDENGAGDDPGVDLDDGHLQALIDGPSARRSGVHKASPTPPGNPPAPYSLAPIIPLGHGFTLRSAQDIYEPLPPVDYLVSRVMRRGSLVLLGAYGSSGKTWQACDLLVSVGSGSPWLGRYETERSPAVFLDWESGDYELRRRIQAVTRARDLADPSKYPDISICTFPPVYVTSRDIELRLTKLAETHRLIIIDSLAAFSPGVDENSAEMRTGLDIMRRVAEKTGCVFVVLLHAKKTNGDPDSIDVREIFRGSSAIFDAADAAFAVIKRSKRLAMKQVKARHGRAIDDVDIEIVDSNGGVLVTAIDPKAQNGGESQEDLMQEIRERVLTLVRRMPGCSRTYLRGEIGGRGVTVDAAIERLLFEKSIVDTGTVKKMVLWTAGSAPAQDREPDQTDDSE